MIEKKEDTKKIIAVQGLRGILALMVLLCHSPFNDTEYIKGLGAWAVEVFFILSGFCNCLSKSIDNVNINFKNSIRYGFSKIKGLYPIYCIVTIFALPLLIAKLLVFGGDLYSLIARICVNLLLLNTLFPISDNLESIIFPGWFLCTIFFIYMFAPILKRFFFKYDSKKNVIWICFIILIRILLMFGGLFLTPKYINRTPFVRIFDFMIGINLAHICIPNRKKISKRYIFINSLTILSILFVFFFINTANDYVKYILYIFNSICIILSSYVNEGFIQKFLSNKILLYFGNVSGYLFLVHFVIFEYFAGLEILGVSVNKFVVTFLTLLLSIIIIELWIRIETKIVNAKYPGRATKN